MNIFRLVGNEVFQTMQRPSRISKLFNNGRLGKYLRFQKAQLVSRNTWIQENEKISHRHVKSYQDYLFLQKSKLEHLDLTNHEKKFRHILRERIRDINGLQSGCRVLCLGARLGAEVAAFRDLGCYAIGIDLNPGDNNPWVLYGDFQHLEFPNNCVDIVYSNSLDHSFDLRGVFREIGRVLVPGGRVIIEADPGVNDADGIAPDLWATLRWSSVDDLKTMIEELGYQCLVSRSFEYPRRGTHMIFASSF